MITLEEIITRKRKDTPPKLIECAKNNLEFLYKTPNRPYHDYSHVEDCLRKLEISERILDPSERDIAALALIYHDCIYDSRYTDNERLSAERAYVDLYALGFYGPLLLRIHNLILSTTHINPGKDLCEKLIMDIDMSIFGELIDVVLDYEKKIRQEYQFYSTKEYLRGRSTFLKSLLNKSSIYQTEIFQGQYEKTARMNIEYLINELPNLYIDEPVQSMSPELNNEEPIQITEKRYYIKAGVEIHCYKCAFESDCLYREYSSACHKYFLPSQGKLRNKQ